MGDTIERRFAYVYEWGKESPVDEMVGFRAYTYKDGSIVFEYGKGCWTIYPITKKVQKIEIGIVRDLPEALGIEGNEE